MMKPHSATYGLPSLIDPSNYSTEIMDDLVEQIRSEVLPEHSRNDLTTKISPYYRNGNSGPGIVVVGNDFVHSGVSRYLHELRLEKLAASSGLSDEELNRYIGAKNTYELLRQYVDEDEITTE